jgi:hypothetical protein
MPSTKHMSVEFGRDFMIADVTLSDNKSAKVIATIDEDCNVTWIAESSDIDWYTEAQCLSAAKAVFKAMMEDSTDT